MVTWVSIAVSAWLFTYGAELTFRWMFIRTLGSHPFGSATQYVYLSAVYLLFAVMSTLVGPVYPIATTLFYYDQRIRQEGYDIERLMEAAGMNALVTQPGVEALVQSSEEEEFQA
jgi:hypothetical protein